VEPRPRLPFFALAAILAVTAFDLGWPPAPTAPLEPAEECTCIDCDDDGPDSALVTLDLDDDLAPVTLLPVPAPTALGRLGRRAPSAAPPSRPGDNPFRPPRRARA
jgi:hypothetical protein